LSKDIDVTYTQVFTYGSLMFENIFEGVTGERCPHQRAILKRWSRHALLNKTYPGAVNAEDPSAKIDGVLWLHVSDQALQKLDTFEGSPYCREWVTVLVENNTPQKAWIYRWVDDSLICGEWDVAKFTQQHQADFLAHHWQPPQGSTPQHDN
jgi:gamma-glutamylcyclotransferase (GGCT)/AIG2-like uncharacterized protein YtfP